MNRSIVPIVLAIGVLIIYGSIQFYCIMHPGQTVDLVSARVQDIFVIIIGYYFGSSHRQNSDDNKDVNH